MGDVSCELPDDALRQLSQSVGEHLRLRGLHLLHVISQSKQDHALIGGVEEFLLVPRYLSVR